MHTRRGRAGTWALAHVPSPDATVGYDAEVALFVDGSASVYLHGVIVARKDVTGRVELTAEGTVQHNTVEDSFVSIPLTPYVRSVVENRARDFADRARRQLRRIAAAHHTGHDKRHAPTSAEAAPNG
jgi:hypothetical protein